MIEASGTITALDGDYAIIRMDEAGCGRCHEPGGCGGNPLSQVFCATPRTFRLLNPGDSAIGSRVTIVIAEGSLRRSATLAYGLPLLALFLGAIIGSAMRGEAGAIIGALCGLLAGWQGLRYAQRRGLRGASSQPYIKY